MLSHRESDNSHYWSCSSELCMYLHIASWFQPIRWQIANTVQYVEDGESRFVMFSCHLWHVVKTSKIPSSLMKITIWLVNIISTEHNQLWDLYAVAKIEVWLQLHNIFNRMNEVARKLNYRLVKLGKCISHINWW